MPSLAVSLTGCAQPLARGPIVSAEIAELHEPEFEVFDAVEVQQREDGVTYGLIAHDGVLVEPRTPEEEAWLLNPEDQTQRIIERLGDQSIPIMRRSILSF